VVNKMINKKIALSLLSIVSALVIVGGATFAFFSSSATSESNLFGAGDLVLQLDDVNESTPVGTVTASIGASDFAPGADVDGFISLHNDGSIGIAEVEFGATVTETNDGGAASNLADVLLLKVEVDTNTGTNGVCDTPSDITAAMDLAVGNNDGTLRLSELDGDVYDAITPGLAPGVTRDLCINVEFESTAGDEYQNDAISVDFDFTGNQDSSQ